jgi:tetratricopeptide (TPR) repeat protein
VFGLFDIVAIVYGFFAVGVMVQLWRNGRRTFDDQFTAHDRRLAGSATFYLVVPFAVGLHELGHVVATWALGGHIAEWRYMFYWGYVVPERSTPFAPWEDAVTAAAGNLVTLALGFGAIAWTLRQPINAAWNFARLELARILLWLTLAFYPIVSLLFRSFDFHIIRQSLNETSPHAGDITMIAYLGFAFLTWRRWRGPWRKRYLMLATPIYDRRQAAERRLEANPDNVEALRELARIHLNADEAEHALPALERALDAGPTDPETRFLTGLTLLRTGHPRKASEHLRLAGTVLEEDEDRSDLLFEVTLGLAAARLALSDAEGALLTAETARAQRPADPRVLLLCADALMATGQTDEARSRLEGALPDAEGTFAAEIKRRLRALRSS